MDLIAYVAVGVPATFAVALSIWYFRMQQLQWYRLQHLVAEETPSVEEAEVEPIIGKPATDRRGRRVLLLDCHRLGTQDALWSIEHATNEEHAMLLLGESTYDAVVVRMSPLAGPFLRKVAQTHPALCRIIQCNEEKANEVFKAAPDAHMFFRLGSTPATIQEHLLRATALDVRTIEQVLIHIFGSLTKLPALPVTYSRIQQRLIDPKCSLEHIAEAIALDVSVSARVLQLVNSALVNLHSPLGNIKHAVKLIGLRGIRDLCLSIEVFNELAEESPGLLGRLELIQLRALRSAKLARRIMNQGPEVDDAYAACLLHAVGQITLMARAPKAYARVETLLRETGRPVEEVEREVFGITRYEVTAYLLRLWGMPQSVVEAVHFWQKPASVPHYRFTVVDATHVALSMVKAYEQGDVELATIDHDLLYALHRTRHLQDWQDYAASICLTMSSLPQGLSDQKVA